MSDKKEWRDLSESFEKMRLEKEIPCEAFIADGYWPQEEIVQWAYDLIQAEKQRADSLQEKLDDEADLLVKTHNKLMEQRQRADRLEKENQKLKEALEKIACYVKPYDLTSEPIKMIETEEAMIAKEALK